MKNSSTPKKVPSTSPTSPRASSRRPLLIVESPAKAKTISKYLGTAYMVEASVGHIADIPEKKNSVDVDNGFAVEYVLTPKGRETITHLRQQLKKASMLILATDADREGELIAAHLVEFLKPTVPVQRVEFRSVTKDAVEKALAQPRQIDASLVEAAKTRRILDRLYGFEVSPVLWRKVRQNLSAGRVQSPAMRLVVERELERHQFVSAGYFDIDATSATSPAFVAKLTAVDGQRIATGKDFDSRGVLVNDVRAISIEMATAIATVLESGPSALTVSSSAEKAYSRFPQRPFTMSSLYQAAGNRLGMSTAEARVVSQQLFDHGHITYPRTDNGAFGREALAKVRHAVKEVFGDALLSPKARYISGAGKNAQAAHEAIHPTRMLVRRPAGLTPRQQALYELIWQRTIATQMSDASGVTVSITLQTTAATSPTVDCEFSASGTTITSPGFRLAYGFDEEDEKEKALPALAVGESVPMESFTMLQHATAPPARFTEASLVKELEELGIGRPSTYASIIAKLRERYIWSKKGERALVPTITAFAVHRIMTQYFQPLVDYTFTQIMEKDLDRITSGEQMRDLLLTDFYFGAGGEWPGIHPLIESTIKTIDPKQLFAIDLGLHPTTGESMLIKPGILRKGTFSPYLQCGEATRSISDQTMLDELDIPAMVALLSAQAVVVGHIDGVPVIVKTTSTGSYFQLGNKEALPAGSKKPRTAGLLSHMTPETVTIEDAIAMFSLPRTIGSHPQTGHDIVAHFGKFGAYIVCGEDTRSLKDETALFSLILGDAVALLAIPKKPRGNFRGKK